MELSGFKCQAEMFLQYLLHNEFLDGEEIHFRDKFSLRKRAERQSYGIQEN